MPIYWAGVIAVSGMYAAFLVIGWLASRKVKEASAGELILAGRAMPLWIAVMTMTATWVDGGYLLGTAEGAFLKNGGGILYGLQGGACFGVSLVLGGAFFAYRMRAYAFTTLVDPFEVRFGKHWAAVLVVPAMLGEIIWSATLLAAIGATFAVILGMDKPQAILLSAAVVTAYTVVGGMWSVAYTDAFQLALIPLGLLAALPFALAGVGGLESCVRQYQHARSLEPAWTPQQHVAWWDMSLLLILGGIPWNCYFQRVLSCASPETARSHSYLAGVLTMVLTVPPLLLGMAAFVHAWPDEVRAALDKDSSNVLPQLLRDVVPAWVSLLGLGAILGAVTSSFSASILSAGSLFSWNVYRRLWFPALNVERMKLTIRLSILLLAAGATTLALLVQSVQKLWLFTADLIFVLLVPQLVAALFDPKANRVGSMTAFVVSLALRLAGGEPIFGIAPLIPYHDWFAPLLPGEAQAWSTNTDGLIVTLFPFKTLAFLVGMILLPVVSRWTAAWDAPRPLRMLKE